MGSAVFSKSEVQITRLDGKPGQTGTDLNKLSANLEGTTALLSIEKYAPEGAYEIKGGQTQYLQADKLCPMVLYAPGEWTPYPGQRPFPPIYFKVPVEAKEGRITFEGSAWLFDPSGSPFPDEKPVSGEVRLPGDRPGLWSFKPNENKKVSVQNLPPYFAFGDPTFYFEPPAHKAAPATQ
jgi:hypothetical protein